jgi:hypothetical protein
LLSRTLKNSIKLPLSIKAIFSQKSTFGYSNFSKNLTHIKHDFLR